MSEKKKEDWIVSITSTVLAGQKRDHSGEISFLQRKIYTFI